MRLSLDLSLHLHRKGPRLGWRVAGSQCEVTCSWWQSPSGHGTMSQWLWRTVRGAGHGELRTSHVQHKHSGLCGVQDRKGHRAQK